MDQRNLTERYYDSIEAAQAYKRIALLKSYQGQLSIMDYTKVREILDDVRNLKPERSNKEISGSLMSAVLQELIKQKKRGKIAVVPKKEEVKIEANGEDKFFDVEDEEFVSAEEEDEEKEEVKREEDEEENVSVVELKAEIVDLEAQIDEMKKLSNEYEITIGKLEGELEDCQAKDTDIDDRLVTRRNEIVDLRNQLAVTRKNFDAVSRNLDELNQTIQEQNEQIDALNRAQEKKDQERQREIEEANRNAEQQVRDSFEELKGAMKNLNVSIANIVVKFPGPEFVQLNKNATLLSDLIGVEYRKIQQDVREAVNKVNEDQAKDEDDKNRRKRFEGKQKQDAESITKEANRNIIIPWVIEDNEKEKPIFKVVSDGGIMEPVKVKSINFFSGSGIENKEEMFLKDLDNLTAPYLAMFKNSATLIRSIGPQDYYKSVNLAWNGNKENNGFFTALLIIARSLHNVFRENSGKEDISKVFAKYLDWLMVKLWTGKEDYNDNVLTAGTWGYLLNKQDKLYSKFPLRPVIAIENYSNISNTVDLYTIYSALYGNPKLDTKKVGETFQKLTGIKLYRNDGLPRQNMKLKDVTEFRTFSEKRPTIDGEYFYEYGLYPISKALNDALKTKPQFLRGHIDTRKTNADIQINPRDMLIDNLFLDTRINFTDKPNDNKYSLLELYGKRPSVPEYEMKKSAGLMGKLKRALGVGPSVTQLLGKQKNTKTLARLLEFVSLGEVLDQNPGPFTVLAPTDKAFEQFLLDYGISDPMQIEYVPVLKDLLQYHVYKGVDYAKDYGKEKSERFTRHTLLDEEDIEVTAGIRGVKFQDSKNNRVASVVKSDLNAKNGVVHLIDRVLVFSDFAFPADVKPDYLPKDVNSAPLPPPIATDDGDIPTFMQPGTMAKVSQAIANAANGEAAYDLINQLRDDVVKTSSSELKKLYPTEQQWTEAHDQVRSAFMAHDDAMDWVLGDDSDNPIDQIYDSYFA